MQTALTTGRAAQKLRTRKALLATARARMERGETTAVAAVAEEAGISKATAYRYFTTAETLAMEAVLDGHFASPEEVVGREPDVRKRVLRVARYTFKATREQERNFRLFLAKALEASVREGAPQVRGARRLPMYELALAPVRAQLGEARHLLLVQALTSVTGIETYVTLVDVCGLDAKRGEAVMLLTVNAVLDSFLGPVRKGV